MLIKEKTTQKILTVGPDYKDHRGGIGAVLSTYASFYESFNFIPTYKYHNQNLVKSFYYLKQVVIFFTTLVLNRKIEIVHIHGSHKGSFYRKYFLFLIAKKIFGKKVIYHMHSDNFDVVYKNSAGIYRKLIRHFINNSDALICLAPYWKKFFLEHFDNKKVLIINNVVLKPAKKIEPDSDASHPVNFLFLGRIGHRKGIFDILKVLSEKRELFNGKMRLHAGGDGETEKIKSFIIEHKLEEFVEYVGWINGESKQELLSKSDVYILPSYSEGLPISILEAMSYKLPIISTPVGGIPEIVGNDINGILVNPGSLSEIESALLFFINNKNKIKEYGNASYEKIKPFFPEYVSVQLEALYENLLLNQDASEKADARQSIKIINDGVLSNEQHPI